MHSEKGEIMKRSIFILSNSIIENEILYNINYLLNIEISTVYLLIENHGVVKPFAFDCNFEIILSDDLDYCIDSCDMIILIKSEGFPEKSVEYIKFKSSLLKKKLYLLNTLDFVQDRISIDNLLYASTPVVLHISDAIHSQHFCLEVLLNKIFNKNNVSIKQVYSQYTHNILNQLKNENLLNNNLSYHFDDNSLCSGKCDLILLSQSVDKSNLIEDLYSLKHTKPDYVIYQTGFEFSSYENINNIAKYLWGSKIDLIVKSRYYRIDEDLIIHIDNINSEKGLFYDLESPNLMRELEFDILSKLTFPEGFIPIN